MKCMESSLSKRIDRDGWANTMWSESKTLSLMDLEDALNENFVMKILVLAKQEEIERKELYSRLKINIDDGVYSNNMKKVLLKSFSKAFNHIYGDSK